MGKKVHPNKFHVEFRSGEQKLAWNMFQEHDVMFLSGVAGTGKTHMAMAFAISELLQGRKTKIVISRPIVSAGENLGFLPGDFHEKVDPYMMPMYDCIDKLVGREGMQREIVMSALEVAPVAYLRGRSLNNAVCIFDEAQNATPTQLKLFLTRLGEGSKMIITGDPMQSDIGHSSGFISTMSKLEQVAGIAIINFTKVSNCRHPLVTSMLERLGEEQSI
jgi:phosphate starvation-inducible PhoH-like protein